MASANEYGCAHHVTWSPNKLWRSNSIFNLWLRAEVPYSLDILFNSRPGVNNAGELLP